MYKFDEDCNKVACAHCGEYDHFNSFGTCCWEAEAYSVKALARHLQGRVVDESTVSTIIGVFDLTEDGWYDHTGRYMGRDSAFHGVSYPNFSEHLDACLGLVKEHYA